jgi:hypothetical protein
MRKLLFSALALSGLFFASCNSDKCKDKVCGNGTCNIVTGACDCTTGYEADVNGACNTEARAKVVGASGSQSWTAKDTVSSGFGFSTTAADNYFGYASMIGKGTNVSQVTVKNLGFFEYKVNNVITDYNVNGTITGNTITLDNTQTIGTAATGTYKFSGTGTALNAGTTAAPNFSKIKWVYTCTYTPAPTTIAPNPAPQVTNYRATWNK